MPARPARPLSPAMCVLCNVLSLRWLVCSFGCDRVSSRLLVGCFQLLLFPVAMRLFRRVATRCPAVNAHSPGCRVVALVVCCECAVCAKVALQVRACCRFVSVSLALGCHTPPSTTHSSTYALHTPHIHSSTHTACTSPRHSHLTRRAPHSHRTDRIFTTPSIIPPTPRTLRTHHIHTTPHPLITHNHPHQSHYHKLVLCSRKFEMVTVYAVPRGCTLCLIKSDKCIQSCKHPSQV